MKDLGCYGKILVVMERFRLIMKVIGSKCNKFLVLSMKVLGYVVVSSRLSLVTESSRFNLMKVLGINYPKFSVQDL